MKTCFVIDGEKEFLIIAERHLTLLGYQVQTFVEAALLFQSISAKVHPDLIIIGENRSVSNLIFIQEARKAFTNSLIIYVAKSNDPDQSSAAIKAGADEFIEKDNALFVRMRTSIDLLEKQNKKGVGAILKNIKKAFSR